MFEKIKNFVSENRSLLIKGASAIVFCVLTAVLAEKFLSFEEGAGPHESEMEAGTESPSQL